MVSARSKARQGNVYAQWRLGDMYERGTGVLEDYKEAMKWYRLAAEQSYAQAQISLGGMHESGEGVRKNLVLAYMWYNIAVANTSDLLPKYRGLPTEGRNSVEAHMTAKQVAEAQELAGKCTAKKFKGC